MMTVSEKFACHRMGERRCRRACRRNAQFRCGAENSSGLIDYDQWQIIASSGNAPPTVLRLTKRVSSHASGTAPMDRVGISRKDTRRRNLKGFSSEEVRS